jgi:hypothetical protein
MQNAWAGARLGQNSMEFGFCIFNKGSCEYAVTKVTSSNDYRKNKQTIPPSCQIIVHTHPNNGGAYPSDNDKDGANLDDVDDISAAEKAKKVICVISQRGFSCYYPNSLPYEHPDKGRIIQHRDSDFSAPCDKKPPIDKEIQKIKNNIH